MFSKKNISKAAPQMFPKVLPKVSKSYPKPIFPFWKWEREKKQNKSKTKTLRESWLYNFWNQSDSLRLDDLLFSLEAERYLLTIEYNQTWKSDPTKVLRETCQYHLCQFKSFKSRNILHKNSHRKSFLLRRKKEIITVVLCYCCY